MNLSILEMCIVHNMRDHTNTQTDNHKNMEKEWNISGDSVRAIRLPSEPVHNRDL